MRSLPMEDLVWPYRPDLLIRIDFLAWWHEVGAGLWPDPPERLTGGLVAAQTAFFAEACRHPYFLQFTRKKRYLRQQLPLAEAAPVYAQGVAAFLNLLASIQREGYDATTPIGLRSCWIQRSSDFANQPRRRWFIGDGCHRFACLTWLERGRPLPQAYFSVRRRLVHRPLDWRAMLFRLGVLGEEDLAGFDELFAGSATPPWKDVLVWGRAVRQRFRTLDPETLFSTPAVP